MNNGTDRKYLKILSEINACDVLVIENILKANGWRKEGEVFVRPKDYNAMMNTLINKEFQESKKR